jgi:hypothetical protein
MKTLQSILVAIALVVLVSPCVHAGEHHHAQEEHGLSAPQCEQCHACSEEPCSKPDQAVQTSLTPALERPVRQAPVCIVFPVEQFVPVTIPIPSGELLRLQTVQLLI